MCDLGMWYVQGGVCSGCGMLAMWDVWDVGYLEITVWGM